jgi:stress-induced morphogen
LLEISFFVAFRLDCLFNRARTHQTRRQGRTLVAMPHFLLERFMRNLVGNAFAFTAVLLLSGAAQAGEKAITAFNGKDLTGWKTPGDAKNNKWQVGTATLDDKGKLLFKAGGNEMVNVARGANIYTEREFGDCLVEVEVMVPKNWNSGIYLMGRYEIQVFDSFGRTKLTGQDMGAIYSVAVPKVNACKKPGEWQKFVIDFVAPRFKGKDKIANAKFVKVTLNDQVIHENAEVLKGATPGGLSGSEAAMGPLFFQGDHEPVAYRNIRITPK